MARDKRSARLVQATLLVVTVGLGLALMSQAVRISGLAAALRHGPSSLRAWASRRLITEGQPAVPAVLDCAEVEEAQDVAVELAALVDSEEAFAPWIDALRSPQTKSRKLALTCLIDVVLIAFEDCSLELRVALARAALACASDPSADDELIDLAAWLIGDVQGSSDSPAERLPPDLILELLASSSPKVRAVGLRDIGWRIASRYGLLRSASEPWPRLLSPELTADARLRAAVSSDFLELARPDEEGCFSEDLFDDPIAILAGLGELGLDVFQDTRAAHAEADRGHFDLRPFAEAVMTNPDSPQRRALARRLPELRADMLAAEEPLPGLELERDLPLLRAFGIDLRDLVERHPWGEDADEDLAALTRFTSAAQLHDEPWSFALRAQLASRALALAEDEDLAFSAWSLIAGLEMRLDEADLARVRAINDGAALADLFLAFSQPWDALPAELRERLCSEDAMMEAVLWELPARRAYARLLCRSEEGRAALQQGVVLVPTEDFADDEVEPQPAGAILDFGG